ncbi:MAG TPA: hypothetical protein VN661_10635 [Candidatus Acidoferrales bacterium]|nr:hypothetical protein [Candidatus Acidoferrales bacterium]
MSDIEQTQVLLTELAAARFYGSVEVRFDNGKITVIKKTESIKPTSGDPRNNRGSNHEHPSH